MRGRKPSPSVLHRLHGHPGRRGRREGEPCPAAEELFAVPDHLGEDAKREWQRITAELTALRMISTLDLGLLACWCSATGDYVAAERRLRQEPLVIDGRDRGMARNPWLLIRNKAMEQMIRLAAEMGLSPAARPRLQASKAVPPINNSVPGRLSKEPLELFLARHPNRLGRR